MVIDRAEDLLGRDQEVGHLPDGQLKVHLGELEQPSSVPMDVSLLLYLQRTVSFRHACEKRVDHRTA